MRIITGKNEENLWKISFERGPKLQLEAKWKFMKIWQYLKMVSVLFQPFSLFHINISGRIFQDITELNGVLCQLKIGCCRLFVPLLPPNCMQNNPHYQTLYFI